MVRVEKYPILGILLEISEDPFGRFQVSKSQFKAPIIALYLVDILSSNNMVS
jgi:hypothetical protein